jgi:hypothetical protein
MTVAFVILNVIVFNLQEVLFLWIQCCSVEVTMPTNLAPFDVSKVLVRDPAHKHGVPKLVSSGPVVSLQTTSGRQYNGRCSGQHQP